MSDDEIEAMIDQSDKKTMWWALYRLAQALHSARFEDPACDRQPDKRGGLYNVVHYTADHWLPQIPGMPTAEAVAKECRADSAHHELTYWAEQRGLRITGDEFI